jgi:anti-sigma regulatory factor (Ser/Thr protein kinase)
MLTLITAELCAHAVQHGRIPGRNFHVRLAAEGDCRRLRVEVSDTRAERRPVATTATDPDSESGRGLLLVAALADDWGVTDRARVPARRCGRSWAPRRAADMARRQAPSRSACQAAGLPPHP